MELVDSSEVVDRDRVGIAPQLAKRVQDRRQRMRRRSSPVCWPRP
jgi:hypothetical protein